jgi:transcriptional regulator PpsR
MDARTPVADPIMRVPLSALGVLPADAALQALAATCDVALVVDRKGFIRDMAMGTGDLADQGIESWMDRPWRDTVQPENRTKIDDMLAGRGDSKRWRQVNHVVETGDLPIRYLALPTGDDGRLLVVGRDMRAAAALQQRLLRAQQAMERDSLRLRQLEARYRLLFDSAPEAIIVVDSGNRRITDANPAARRLAGLPPGGIDGQPFVTIIHADDREVAIATLGAVAAAEQRQPTAIRLIDGVTCAMSVTLFRQDRGNYLLVRWQPMDSGGAGAQIGDRPLVEVLERMPDAFVLADRNLNILAGNGAFLDLVHAARSADLRGKPLANFLGRPGIDLGLLLAQLNEHGLVRNFATIIRAGDGVQEEIEVSAVASIEGDATRYGFSIRGLARRLLVANDDRHLPRSVEQLTELVGRVSLKEIVRESTDLIERLCIEAALTYTSDNRASAAEILGLSRQSLYSKLHRHGLGNLSDTD